ncbi:MAG: tripartite tricarboxylate transporter substrate binding protein [Alcaligenaceae bacterium]|nr:tripartite tricarboxylate transporter substrate binding protein [Alcaligenaceae bacterium]
MITLKQAFCSWAGKALLAASAALALPAIAQAGFPTQTVTLVVPFSPGGSSDTASRILGELLAQKWGRSVVIENKPGASGSIGALTVANAKSDGHTLLVTPVSIGTIKLFLKNPGFDPHTDLTPIAQFAKGDYVLSVNPKVPVNNMAEFVEYARKNPDTVFHGAFGSASRLAFEDFALKNGVTPENVNYRGEALVLNALIAGEVQVALTTLVGAKPFLESGRIKALGIPAKARSPIAPQIPSADESGAPGFHADFWFGLMAPAGVPEDVRRKIAADVGEVLARPEVQERFQALGLLATSSSPEAFAELIKYESERWVETAKHAGIEPQ